MSIRNEFERIDPTEKQKQDIFSRIEESSKRKNYFRQQVIRYSSVAAAAVVVVGTAAVGIHFVTKGNGIDYTVSGSSSAGIITVDSAGSVADSSKADTSDTKNQSNVEDSLSTSSVSDNSAGASANDEYFGINSDVMWGIGKTVDEIAERYGSATMENDNVYTFENGYGKYTFGDSCDAICEISAKNFLVGNLSTVTLENFASKFGLEVVTLNDSSDPNTMYEGLKLAYYTHPFYDNVTISMLYKESGFDETAVFDIRYDGTVNNETKPEITTDENGDVFVTNKLLEKIKNGTLTDSEFDTLVSYVYSGNGLCTDAYVNQMLSELVNVKAAYNNTIQKTFNRLMLSGFHENDDEWHITSATPGGCHSMKEWYDLACTMYADMPSYEDFTSIYSEQFKFDENGSFYYSSDYATDYLITMGPPFNAPSYRISDISPRSFGVNESTNGGEGLKVGVLYFDGVGTDGSTYRMSVNYFDVIETDAGYRFVVNTNS